ncbi:MAG: hypothetical protein ACYDAZ_06905 [Thermoplasmataceae archaeon]
MQSMIRAMNLSGLGNKYSVESMFLELERTKKQRDILSALEKISWG